jgi:hypothetical protein
MFKRTPFNLLLAIAGIAVQPMAYGQQAETPAASAVLRTGLDKNLFDELSRVTYDEAGTAWMPAYACSGRTMGGTPTKLDIYYVAPKGKKAQLVVRGNYSGKPVNEYVALDPQAPAHGHPGVTTLVTSFGKISIDLANEHVKETPPLGGTMNFLGKKLTNLEAQYVLDAMEGHGLDFDGSLDNGAGKLSLFCESQIPYLKTKLSSKGDVAKKSSEVKKSARKAIAKAKTGPKVLPEVVVSCKGDRTAQKLQHFARVTAKYRELMETEGKGHWAPERFSKVDRKGVRELDFEESIGLLERTHGKGLKYLMHKGYSHESTYIYKLFSEELKKSETDPNEAFKLLNKAFATDARIGMKVLESVDNEDLEFQLRMIARHEFGSFEEYSAAMKKGNHPAFGEAAYNGIAKVMDRGLELMRSPIEQPKPEAANPDEAIKPAGSDSTSVVIPPQDQ